MNLLLPKNFFLKVGKSAVIWDWQQRNSLWQDASYISAHESKHFSSKSRIYIGWEDEVLHFIIKHYYILEWNESENIEHNSIITKPNVLTLYLYEDHDQLISHKYHFGFEV